MLPDAAKKTAVFLDRDGTIIENSGYVTDPHGVRLLPHAADAIRRFAGAEHLVVLVSNQSGVARGLFDEQALSIVHARVEELLAAQGVKLNGAYYCPYLDGPEAIVEQYRRDSELRKPKPGMLLLAARELNIDLSRSWMIGDSASDVEAGRAAGCRTILLQPDGTPVPAGPTPTQTVADLREAADVVENDRQKDRYLPGKTSDAPLEDEVAGYLRRILQHLERTHRRDRQHDFSILRLFASLLQMSAILAGLWGAMAITADQVEAATARFAMACFLQLASMSAFAVDRFK